MLRILIADDHAVVRAGLRRIVEDAGDMQIVADTGSGREAVALASDCDVAVLDISMPDLTGVQALAEIHSARPTLPVLILTGQAEEQYGERLLRAGAAGFILKESATDELVAAIRKVARGGTWVSASLAERLALRMRGGDERPWHERLSARENSVLKWLASGMTVSQIAEQTGLSIKTISTYRTRILEKSGMASNAELTHYAIMNGLVE